MLDAGTGIDRRAVLAGGALTLAGCTPRPPLTYAALPAELPVFEGFANDVHAHFFNIADLPVARFITYTKLRKTLGGFNRALIALVDFIGVVLKDETPSATQELDEITQGKPGVDLTPDAFEALLRKRVLFLSTPQAKGAAAFKSVTGAAATPGDYAALTKALAATLPSANKGALGLDTTRPFAAAARAALARGPGAAVAPQDVVSDIRALVEWTYLMTLRRRTHVSRYVESFVPAGTRPVVLNLLIDYDKWLDDRPKPGSEPAQQIALWAKVRDSETRIDLRTFGAYCPLRHAIDAIKTPQNTVLDSLRRHLERREIAGIKLYPPMGFFPSGNRGLPDDDYTGNKGGVGGIPLAAFREAKGTGLLGDALQDRLDDLYRMAAGQWPIMAHAGTGNAAGANFEARAKPKGWIDVARKHPTLHLCLGHFTFEYDDFIRAVAADTPGDPPATGVFADAWPYSGTQLLIRDAPDGRQSNVFADISYSDVAYDGDGRRAVAYFAALRRFVQKYDPDFSQIVYGTDWIMLGIEGGSSTYFGKVGQYLLGAGWQTDELTKLFQTNLKRFLSGGRA